MENSPSRGNPVHRWKMLCRRLNASWKYTQNQVLKYDCAENTPVTSAK